MAVPNFEPADRRSAPLHLRLLPDERLARRAESGDRRAFETIHRRYRQDLYRFCLAMTGDPQGAETALRATMAKVQRGLEAAERQIKLKPWLYRIARNETIDWLPVPRETGALEPEQHHLLADLDQLPQRQRAVLVMHELSGLDFAQIGIAFGISATAAMEVVYEARLKLRQLQEGREQRCAKVMWELSEVDGQASRRRKIRAHLRHCPDCRTFRDEIAARRGGLAALPPLPLAGGGSSLAGTVAAVVGNTAGTSVAVKAAATVAVVAATGISVAEKEPPSEPAQPSARSGAPPWSVPSAQPSLPDPDEETSAVAVRHSVAPPPTPSYPDPAIQPSTAYVPARPDSREEVAPDDGSTRPEIASNLPNGDQGQFASQPHESVSVPLEEVAQEPPDAVASETTNLVSPPEPEAPVDSAEEVPSGSHDLPATPAPEVETPPAPPSPPAYDGGSPRRPGDWSRNRRPRHRH